MAGIGNISQIEMNCMNSIISLSKAYRENSKLVQICDISLNETIFVPKNKILSLYSYRMNYYIVTENKTIPISKEQFEKLIKEW